MLKRHITALHQYHVNHEDLTPHNVLISEMGKLFIIDFEFSDLKHQCHSDHDQCPEIGALLDGDNPEKNFLPLHQHRYSFYLLVLFAIGLGLKVVMKRCIINGTTSNGDPVPLYL
jgi:serine/threonine protein kinase